MRKLRLEMSIFTLSLSPRPQLCLQRSYYVLGYTYIPLEISAIIVRCVKYVQPTFSSCISWSLQYIPRCLQQVKRYQTCIMRSLHCDISTVSTTRSHLLINDLLLSFLCRTPIDLISRFLTSGRNYKACTLKRSHQGYVQQKITGPR